MEEITKPVMGRPTIITEDVSQKLVDILRLGCSDKAACAYAKISRETFYNRIQKDADFRDKMEDARNYAIIASREVVVSKIIRDKDPEYAKWYIEKHDIKTQGTQQNTQVNIFQDLKDKYTVHDAVDTTIQVKNEQP